MRLENPVRAAVQAAMNLNDEHERYKERKRAFEATWKELKKKTKSLVTEKNSSLEDYIQSRLSEAEGVRHTETGLPEAYKILEELEGRSGFKECRFTRAFSREDESLETELAENFRAIRDLAREFNVELDDFKDRFIPSVN